TPSSGTPPSARSSFSSSNHRVGVGELCSPEPVAGGFGNPPRVPELFDLDDARAAPVAGVPAAARTVVPLDPVAARAVAGVRRTDVAAGADRAERQAEPENRQHASNRHGSSLAPRMRRPPTK